MAEPRTWILEIPAPGGQVYNANHDHRVHWYSTNARRHAARIAARLLARAQRIPPLKACRVEATIHIKAWRSADPQNYPGGSTVKGILDGLVDAAVVRSDRAEHMQVTMPTLAPLGGGVTRVMLRITELTEVAGDG